VWEIDNDEDDSRLNWGIPVAADFGLSFHAPPGDIDPEGRRVEVTFGNVFSLGRLVFSTGVIQGDEGYLDSVDLQVAVLLTRPAIPEPVIITLPLTIENVTEQVTPDDL
jgi:hypothetical protein